MITKNILLEDNGSLETKINTPSNFKNQTDQSNTEEGRQLKKTIKLMEI